jgi:hypothetical protein
MKKAMPKMFCKKMRKIPCPFPPNCLLRFFMFLRMLHGEFKNTPKQICRKNHQKSQKKSTQPPPWAFFWGFQRPLGVQFTAPVMVPYAISLGISIEQLGYLYTTQFVNWAPCNCGGCRLRNRVLADADKKTKTRGSLATERL